MRRWETACGFSTFPSEGLRLVRAEGDEAGCGGAHFSSSTWKAGLVDLLIFKPAWSTEQKTKNPKKPSPEKPTTASSPKRKPGLIKQTAEEAD